MAMPPQQQYHDFEVSDEEDFGNSPEKPLYQNHRTEGRQPTGPPPNNTIHGLGNRSYYNPPNSTGHSVFPSSPKYPSSPVVINTYLQPGMASNNVWLQVSSINLVGYTFSNLTVLEN